MPDGMKLTIEGADELNRALKSLEKDVATKIGRSAVRLGANVIKKEAEANLDPFVDTGELQRSIRVRTKVDRRKKSITASVTNSRQTFYGMFLEFGTVHITAHHWLRNAIRDSGQRALDRMGETIRKRVAKTKAKKR